MFVSITARVRRLLRNEDGPTAVEYAVMLALILAVIIVSLHLTGISARDVFRAAANAL